MTNKFEALKNSDDSGEDEHGSKDIKSADLISSVPVEIPPGDHKLQYCYWLWYSRRSPGKQSLHSFDQNLKLIGTFGSVEQFWAINSHLARPSELQSHSDFHLFKVGIKPMWEVYYAGEWKVDHQIMMKEDRWVSDEANQRGGKWIVRLRKGLASRCWENLVLAMLGEQFMVGQEICGAVVSIRFQEDIICVWNKTASDQATTSRIRDTMRRVLNLPPNTVLEYKTHNDSLKSLKNTATDTSHNS